MKQYTIITCPNCKEALSNEGRVWKCPNNHSFDVSKEGYLNLLLANKKKTKNPGDTKQMIRSREQFLGTGAFDFLIDRLKTEVKSLLDRKELGTGQKEQMALDLGCGSGFYTRNVFGESSTRIGIDISKEAASIAARTDKSGLYLVASAFEVPLSQNSVDVALNVFAPLDFVEIHRLLKEHGRLIKVIPDHDHMVEISEMIYDEVKEHATTFEKEVEKVDGLQVLETFQLKKKVVVSAENLKDLIAMTPFFYKFKAEELENLKEQEVTLSFRGYVVGKV